MYVIKFKGLNLVSNKKKISNLKIVFFFYGIGNASNDFDFLLKNVKKGYQLIIPELPGHNNYSYSLRNFSLEDFSQRLSLFIKKKNIVNVSFFSHSVGGIIPILIAKNIKRKVHIDKFINYEGNLTEHDTNTITKKTASYKINEFRDKFKILIERCQSSDQKSIKRWSCSLKKVNASAFHVISCDAVNYSRKRNLLKFFRIFFKKKVYLFGSNSNLVIPEYSFGSRRLSIKRCGHFAFFENSYKFSLIFSKLVYGRI